MRRLLVALPLLAAACAAPVPRPTLPAAAATVSCRIGPDDGPPAPMAADEPAGDRGIGGTGMLAAGEGEGDRGIGGTGIVGVVTGFGSVCVGGLRVATGPGLAVSYADRTAGTDSLRAGQVVVLEASGPDSAPRARRIAVRHEAAGTVEAVEDGALVVAGQRVRVGPGVRGRTDWRVGDRIEVSGLRAPDGEVIATRLDARPAAASGVTTVYGTLTRRDGEPRIGRLRVRPAPGAALPPDGPVVASGRVADGVLLAASVAPDRLARDPEALFGPGIGRLLIEGFAGVGGGRLTLGSGLAVPAPAGVSDPVRRGVVEFRRDPARGLVPAGLRDATGTPRAGFGETVGPARGGMSGARAPVPDRRMDQPSAARAGRGGAAEGRTGRGGMPRGEGRSPGPRGGPPR